MRRTALITGLFGFLLAACAEPGTYPGSGDSCSPKDPVLALDAHHCASLPGGSGSF